MARDPGGLLLKKMAQAGDREAIRETTAEREFNLVDGWPEAFSVDAFPKRETMNQLFYIVSALLEDIVTHGILEWNADTAFIHPAVCLGSDGNPYISKQSSGGENPSQDPTTDTQEVYWKDLVTIPDTPDAPGNASTTARGIVELATPSESTGNDATRAITPAGLSHVLGTFIPSGTRMVFYQASAPTGWTKVSTINDRVLRVVSGTGGGTGGNWRISGISVSGHTLTTSEMPSHTHAKGTLATLNGGSHTHNIKLYDKGGEDHNTIAEERSETLLFGNQSTDPAGTHSHTITGSTGSTGGGGSHSHGLTIGNSWRPAYADVIVCSKD